MLMNFMPLVVTSGCFKRGEDPELERAQEGCPAAEQSTAEDCY